MSNNQINLVNENEDEYKSISIDIINLIISKFNSKEIKSTFQIYMKESQMWKDKLIIFNNEIIIVFENEYCYYYEKIKLTEKELEHEIMKINQK